MKVSFANTTNKDRIGINGVPVGRAFQYMGDEPGFKYIRLSPDFILCENGGYFNKEQFFAGAEYVLLPTGTVITITT